MRRLRTSQSMASKKYSAYLSRFQQSLSGVIAKAEDSGSDDPHITDKQANSIGMKLLKHGTGTGKSSDSFRSTTSVRSSEFFDQNSDDEDDQFVLMRSLGGRPTVNSLEKTPSLKKPAVTIQKSVSFEARPDVPSPARALSFKISTKSGPADHDKLPSSLPGGVGESIIVINSDEKGSDPLRLRTSQASSKASSSRSGRYSPSDERSNLDDYRSESKERHAVGKGKNDDSLSETKDKSGTIDSTETSGYKNRSKTLDSTISDLTMSGIHEEKGDFNISGVPENDASRGSEKSSPDTLGRSRDLSENDGASTSRQFSFSSSEVTKPNLTSMVSTTKTPLTNSSTISPFAELKENDEDDASESLALSESNDAFPFLEESQDDLDQNELPANRR